MYSQKRMWIESESDGLKISVLALVPGAEEQKTCRGIVQIVHGMCEYKERYLPLMEYLAEKGFASIVHDHRGHGDSVKSDADYGYMYEVGTDAFLNDMLQVNKLAGEEVPGVPVIMFGHSMGSLAARGFVREHDDCVDALVLSGAPCKNGAVGVAILLAKLQKLIYGGKHTANLLRTLSFAAYQSRFKDEASPSAWTCSDPDVVAYYDKDPKCGFTFRVDGYQVLFDLMKRTYDKQGWKCSKPKMPILFMAGSDDPCIGNLEKFEEEMQYMGIAGYEDITGIVYDGMRHEICNEPDKIGVFMDLEEFLTDNGF